MLLHPFHKGEEQVTEKLYKIEKRNNTMFFFDSYISM